MSQSPRSRAGFPSFAGSFCSKREMKRVQSLAVHFLRRASLSSTVGASGVDPFGVAVSLPRVAVLAPRFRSFSVVPGSLPEDGGARTRRPSFSIAGFASLSVAASGAAMIMSDEAEAKEPLPFDLCPRNVVLYQYEACPFCNKVRAFLDYHGIAYTVVEVNPLSKKEIKWSDYKKVPILTVDGEPLVDSSDIITKLDSRIHPKKPVGEENSTSEEAKWRRWVDDHLVHVLAPNIYRNTSEALEAFNYITNEGNFSTTERFTVKYAGAAAMYFVSKKLKKKHNITDERAALYEAVETWTEALNGRDFLGGSKPNLADLAVFGVLRPIRYLRAGEDMVKNTAIGDWYNRMENAVGESSRIKFLEVDK